MLEHSMLVPDLEFPYPSRNFTCFWNCAISMVSPAQRTLRCFRLPSEFDTEKSKGMAMQPLSVIRKEQNYGKLTSVPFGSFQRTGRDRRSFQSYFRPFSTPRGQT